MTDIILETIQKKRLVATLDKTENGISTYNLDGDTFEFGKLRAVHRYLQKHKLGKVLSISVEIHKDILYKKLHIELKEGSA